MSISVSTTGRLRVTTLERLIRDRLGAGELALLAGGAIVVGASAIPSVDLLEMNDLGLVSVMPLRLLLALAAVTIGFLVAVARSRVRMSVAAAYLILLIVALYGLPAVVATEAGHHVAWRHAGIVDYVVRQGSVDGSIDAYFNWPGFFILVAFLTEAADTPEVLSASNWAPLFFSLLCLGPLLMIFRTATGDQRVVWLGVGVFYLANWVGQDYFSPQAFSYFLYLVLLALLLRWFADSGRRGTGLSAPRWLQGLLRPGRTGTGAVNAPAGSPLPAGYTGGRGWRQVALLGVAVLLFAAVVPAHQLTPFAALISVAALVLLRLCSARGLPVLMGVITISWLAFMTIAYLEGHIEQLLGGIGDLGAATTENVSGRVGGSAEHELVVKLRIAFSAGLWLLAAVGAFLRYRKGSRDGALVALALAPFPLIALQSYGGEMLLRIYLFSLPFVAFFVATLLSRVLLERAGRGWLWRGAGLSAAGLLLLAGFMLCRYGNERINVFSPDEVAAVERLYDIAPAGATLTAGSVNVPWKAENYERFDHEYVTETAAWESPGAQPDMPAVVHEVAESMREEEGGSAFLLTTERQHAYVDLLGPAPPGSLSDFERAVTLSGQFRVVYENSDARIWTLRERGEPSS